MLVRLTPRRRFEILDGQYEPMLRVAFLEAIDDIRSNIVLRRVVERLERGDINGAVAAMHLDEVAFRPLDEAIRQAFNGGGVAAVEQMPALRDPEGHRFVIRFDARNVEAENWLRQHSTTLVSNIIADQQEGIRTALSAGLYRGDKAPDVASAFAEDTHWHVPDDPIRVLRVGRLAALTISGGDECGLLCLQLVDLGGLPALDCRDSLSAAWCPDRNIPLADLAAPDCGRRNVL